MASRRSKRHTTARLTGAEERWRRTIFVADLWGMFFDLLGLAVVVGLMALVVGAERVLEMGLALPVMAVILWLSKAKD